MVRLASWRHWLEETVTFMDDDPALGFGLKPVSLSDQALIDSYFQSLKNPLSDYTFSQLYTWRNSLRILWTQLEGYLCVFANGSGDLTMLAPPIAPDDDRSGARKALAGAWEIMQEYNNAHGVPSHTRVEYASEELLACFDPQRLDAQRMGMDYIYDVNRMIDLAGGDLASKRQARNRFQRNYAYRVEPYCAPQHETECRRLLAFWKNRQDAAHSAYAGINGLKRQKEALACQLTIECAQQIGLRGIVVYVRETPDSAWSLRGFTFGEHLGTSQSSIVIEKTDLQIKGLAQFIFSEFCRQCWNDRPLVNVGDDWGLESLAWTKMSYRPVKLLNKYSFTMQPVVRVVVLPAGYAPGVASAAPVAPVVDCTAVEPVMTLVKEIVVPTQAKVRLARKDDLAAVLQLEQNCFSTHRLGKRQLQYLQHRSSAVFFVAELAGKVVGEGICLVRRNRAGSSGRIYSLAVDPACRGQKLGRKLLRQMIQELVRRGVQRIYLEVEQSNAAAIAIYDQFGFNPIGVMSDYYGKGRAGLHMMRQARLVPSLFDLQHVA